MSALSATNGTPTKIGIVGYYGVGNLGDETVVAILINRIRAHYPHAEVVGISLNPEDTQRRHGIKALPMIWRREGGRASAPHVHAEISFRRRLYGRLKKLLMPWPFVFRPLKAAKDFCCRLPHDLPFLRRTFSRLKGFEMLVVPGSGPLTDWWGGAFTHPYFFWSWAFLARLRGVKVIVLSIGSERLTTRLGKRFCKSFLSMAQYRSFRDRSSRDAMKVLGVKDDDPVFPDQGFALDEVLGSAAPEECNHQYEDARSGLIIAVSPLGQASYVPDDGDDSVHKRYIERLSAVCVWLLTMGYRIAFCPTDCVQDTPFVEEIIAYIKTALPGVDLSGQILNDPILTTADLVKRIQMCDMMIASRFHGIVLSFALQKPVLALSYGKKMSDLMIACGQGAYHRDLDKAEVAEVIQMFKALEHNRRSIAQHLGAVVSDYKCMLDKQYRHVFGTVPAQQREGRGPDGDWMPLRELRLHEAMAGAGSR
jgi:polysaccharide pyruvyl transferase WcaK-like protein